MIQPLDPNWQREVRLFFWLVICDRPVNWTWRRMISQTELVWKREDQ